LAAGLALNTIPDEEMRSYPSLRIMPDVSMVNLQLHNLNQ
jgi:hypothetical protein